jgi:hypothetical protein
MVRPDSLATNAAKIRAINNPSSLPKSMSALGAGRSPRNRSQAERTPTRDQPFSPKL